MGDPISLPLQVMSNLAGEVVKLGVCPFCHERSLRHVVTTEGYVWQQCRKCKQIFVDEDDAEGSDNGR